MQLAGVESDDDENEMPHVLAIVQCDETEIRQQEHDQVYEGLQMDAANYVYMYDFDEL